MIGHSGDGGPALEAQLDFPEGIAVDASGNVFIASEEDDTVRKIDALGMITTFAGTGVDGFNGDGIDASTAQLSGPYDVAVDGAGNVFIAEVTGNRVRKVDTTGIISTVVVGDPTKPSAMAPSSLAFDATGRLHIASLAHNCILRVNANGTLTRIAGIEVFSFPNQVPDLSGGYNGDGIAASSARLKWPHGLAFLPDGSLVFGDRMNHRVRKISAGTITTIAGTGAAGYDVDGVPATSAPVKEPSDVLVDGDGLLFNDGMNGRVRRIAGDGTISTYAGTGDYGYNGDGIAAAAANLSGAFGLARAADGAVLITEIGTGRVRRVA